jgi:hypothetical protein
MNSEKTKSVWSAGSNRMEIREEEREIYAGSESS